MFQLGVVRKDSLFLCAVRPNCGSSVPVSRMSNCMIQVPDAERQTACSSVPVSRMSNCCTRFQICSMLSACSSALDEGRWQISRGEDDDDGEALWTRSQDRPKFNLLRLAEIGSLILCIFFMDCRRSTDCKSCS